MPVVASCGVCILTPYDFMLCYIMCGRGVSVELRVTIRNGYELPHWVAESSDVKSFKTNFYSFDSKKVDICL